MFLDPEPKRSKHGTVMSTLSPASRAPTAGKQQQGSPNARRKPLQERTQSEVNQRTPTASEKGSKGSIQLVNRPLSSHKRNAHRPLSVHRPISVHRPLSSHSQRSAKRPTSLRSIGENARPLPKTPSKSSPLNDENTAPAEPIEKENLAPPNDEPIVHLTPATNIPTLELTPSTTFPPRPDSYQVPKTSWHRRSASSSVTPVSPLRDEELAMRNNRFSTMSAVSFVHPTVEADRLSASSPDESIANRSSQTLETVDESNVERSIRIVPSTDSFSNSDGRSVASGSPPLGNVMRRSASVSSGTPVSRGTPRKPKITGRALSMHLDNESRASLVALVENSTPIREQASSESLVSNDEFTRPSSPIVVVYGNNSPQSTQRVVVQPLRFTPSVESIQQRLQYPTVIRPQPATPFTFVSNASMASLASTGSNDTLPSLNIPKKRLRHQPATADLQTLMDEEDAEDAENVDTQPYRRPQFNRQLSTIVASECDTRSWVSSQRMSAFSSPGDEAAHITGAWPLTNRQESNFETIEELPAGPAPGSRESAGDMTLGIFRAESAKPQPLFRHELPALPPPSPDSETADQVTALQSPELRAMKSNKSMRRLRSNSTPTLSRQQSNISNISENGVVFPRWARNFYSGKMALLSSSKVSLALPPPKHPGRANKGKATVAQRPAMTRQRSHSELSERSFISRVGTGYSTADSEVRQEQFREQLRQLQHETRRARKTHWRNSSAYSAHSASSRLDTGYSNTTGWSGAETESSGNVEYFNDDFRPPARMAKHRQDNLYPPSSLGTGISRSPSHRIDSMEIFSNHLRINDHDDDDVYSVAHSHWSAESSLEHEQRPAPPPKARIRSRHRDQVQYRPQTPSDAPFEIQQIPHLMPSQRVSQNGLSVWPPPSFAESFGSLLHSRCNRQILLFAVGFICPVMWILAAFLPLPEKPMTSGELEKNIHGSDDYVQAQMMRHEAQDPERRYRDERMWVKAVWWRGLNRIMSVVGVLVIAAIIALAVVASA